ncbi:PRAME family member 8-like [Myotis daubentonii]|uniref:PRAME family member 8-like n=1 Tax=Myotis daubentonii TaxID=98922 RepID=UPI0028731A3C|nr:PRAME family member 8-like [Myotis daubentonii]
MSIRMPPTILKLAAKRLLREQASAIASLEYLPAELFPYLFKMAYCGGRHPQLLKALAQAWPFTVLPLRVLMQRPPDHAPTRAVGLKAVFDAIDVVLAQEVRPRISANVLLSPQEVQTPGAGFKEHGCQLLGYVASSQHRELLIDRISDCAQLQTQHGASLAPLEVFLDLTFDERGQDKFFMHIIQWAQQREGLLHLCCKTLRTSEVPFQRVRKVLDRVRLDCIQDVKVNTQYLHTLRTFALYLGAMSNLQKLFFLEELRTMRRTILMLRHLRQLYMCALSFLPGGLDQVLRCLQTPLDKFCLMFGQRLTHSDLTYLFQCPNLRQLKFLYLCDLSLVDFSGPLRALLEAVAPTLQGLGLDKCGMGDS